MKLLCVGGNGHYAGLITRHLAEKHDLTVLDVNAAPCDFKCTQVIGSVLKRDDIERAAAGADAIVTFFFGDAELSTMGMANVMTVAERLGIRHVVYTSSGGMSYPTQESIAGDEATGAKRLPETFWRDYFPIREEAGMFPGYETSSYFLHKWLCEQIGRHFAERGNVKFTAMRPGLLMHDDMTNRDPGETNRNYLPFFMLVTGQVRMCDCAHLYDLALRNPPVAFTAYNCSNDTPYNNLSVEKAKRELGYATLDPKPYMDFYAAMDWKKAFEELTRKGFPASLLRSMYGFRNC